MFKPLTLENIIWDQCQLSSSGCCEWGELISFAPHVILRCCASSTPIQPLFIPPSDACFFSCVYMPVRWNLKGGVNAFLCTRPLTSVRGSHHSYFSLTFTGYRKAHFIELFKHFNLHLKCVFLILCWDIAIAYWRLVLAFVSHILEEVSKMSYQILFLM